MAMAQHRHDLVTGAGGAQGGAVARRLLAAGHQVRGLVRTAAGRQRVPVGARPHTADLGDSAAVEAAFDTVTHAALHLPLVHDPAAAAHHVANMAAAARAAGLEQIVYSTGNRIPAAPTGIAAFETLRAAAATLLAPDLPTVVLRPPVFLDNLRAPWVTGPLLHEGVLRYPLPAAAPVAWLSHDDLAAATAAALDRPDLAGCSLDLGGPEALTGPQLARAFSDVLDRPVRYEEQDPDAFEAGLSAVLGPAATGIADTYRHAAADPALYAADPAPAHQALGIEPTPLRTWIAAQPWHAPAGAAR
ncbi:uncharacterized protein YbjT (DUF2867 family) [Murinocardiopsis flavida]|uniref:Uncharacterized protein YbjT (DUF2867 family) n=1 Tax=Murinocardiopsis flavida TaxID=645275 RepID=A0A2P8DP68_9ACTN|nr:NmrA family NAD(P)-binding protein [Murinocardiopsis flavida]PSK98999.1 uncharacterized protein YbjT (DUF2867 family) [Murinocardiopsis flavida]